MAVWCVKPGKDGIWEETFLENRIVGKGGPAVDLSGKSFEEIKSVYAEESPDMKPRARAGHAGQHNILVNKMKEGDLVVVPLRSESAVRIGRVASGYSFSRKGDLQSSPGVME